MRAVASSPRSCRGQRASFAVRSPIDGSLLHEFVESSPAEVQAAIERAVGAFRAWQLVPPPRRGELVRRIGLRLREKQRPLAELVTAETGKITAEAWAKCRR